MRKRRLIWLAGLTAIMAAVFLLHPKPAPKTVPPTSVVQFHDDQAKDQFLQQNNLQPDQLAPGPDNAYVIPKKQTEVRPTPGATTQPNYIYRALLAPNDPFTPQWYTDKILAPAAWDITTGTSAVTVAVLDTGFALNHEDVANRWATNTAEMGATVSEGAAPNCTSRFLALDKSCNNLDDDSNGKIDDWRGWDFIHGSNTPSAGRDNTDINANPVYHGTTVSGLVGATGNNSKGTASLNWGAKILPVQVLDDYGVGSTSSVVSGVNYAVARGAKIINLSLGQPDDDPTLKTAIDNAIAAGVTVVAAAGNCGGSNYAANNCDRQGQMVYPGNYPAVIAVGATDINDSRASFSSYGPNLDVVAPGDANGTGNDKMYSPFWTNANQTTAYTLSMHGTSFSAPIVAGLAALLKSNVSTLTPADIERIIKATATKLGFMNGQGFTDQYGTGRINAAAALNYRAAAYYAQSAYPMVTAGNNSAAFFKFQNTGSTTWYDDTSVGSAPAGSLPLHLATSHPINRDSSFGTWGNRPAFNFSAVYEADGTTPAASQHIVQPGQIGKLSFSFTIAANQPAGTYREYFQPIIEGTPDGALGDPGTYLDITVQAQTFGATYAGQSAYPTITAGNTSVAFLMYRNIGNQPWYDNTSIGGAPAGNYPLHLATSHPINRTSQLGTWVNRPGLNFTAVYETDGTTLAADQHVVQTGQIGKYSFSFTVPANQPSGVYREFFMPIREGTSDGGMNDPGTYLDVTVQGLTYSAGYIGQSGWPVASPGGTAPGYLKFKNTGNIAWYDDTSLGTAPAGSKPLHLATSHPINRTSRFGTWGNRPALNFSAVYEADDTTLAANQHVVQPGQIGKLSFTYTVPNPQASGAYREYFQPIIEGTADGALGDHWTYQDVIVQ